MLKILLIGYGILVESLLKGILDTEHQVVGFYSWDRRKKISPITRFFNVDTLDALRKNAGIPAIEVPSVNGYEFIEIANKLQPDVILVGSWGEILKEHVIGIPIKYCINCHPSLLPKHRGSNPYASVLKEGETTTGVTFHLIDEGIDTGDIIKQAHVSIDQSDTGETIRYKCCNKARELVPELLEDIEKDRIYPQKQNHSAASYYPRLRASDGAIKWNRPVDQIHNSIRGLYPWIKSYTMLKGRLLIVNKSEIVTINDAYYEPGTIIDVFDNSIIVKTVTENKGILLSGLTVFGMNEFVSRIYLKRLLTVGIKLSNAI